MNLRIGSWPGDGVQQNPFISLFMNGLALAGCSVTGLDTVEAFAEGEFDVIVLHWAERIFQDVDNRWEIPGRIKALLGQMKTLSPRTKFVWLVHNLKPHDARPTARLIWPFYTRALVRRVDGALTLSPGTVAPVQSAFSGLRNKPVAWAWHPAYPDARLSGGAVRTARRKRGWGAGVRVLGYCGQIRPYKGVEDMVTAFLATHDPDWRLLVAGAPRTAELETRLHAAAAQDSRIRLELGNLPTADFREAENCCDVIVAPFKSYLHSGSLIHALSAGRPVLTPTTPFSGSLHSELGADWVQLYEGDLTVDALSAAALAPTPGGVPDMSAFEPEAVGAQMVGFFRKLRADVSF